MSRLPEISLALDALNAAVLSWGRRRVNKVNGFEDADIIDAPNGAMLVRMYTCHSRYRHVVGFRVPRYYYVRPKSGRVAYKIDDYARAVRYFARLADVA